MITITPTAAAQIRAAAAQSGADGMALRLAAKPGADGDIEYGMGFDELRDKDAELECEGVEVLVGASSQELLAGTTLDYVEFQPGEYRFIFVPPCSSRPQAGSCGNGGCGGCGK